MRNLYILMGRSGVGKSAIAQILSFKYGLSEIKSYTDRPKRYAEEKGHIFCSKEEFDKRVPNLVAYTEFDDCRYGVTEEQIAHNDIFVCDLAGIDYLEKHYHGDKKIVVFCISANLPNRIHRMRARGDSDRAILGRLENDFYKYPTAKMKMAAQHCILTDDCSAVEAADTIYNWIKLYEKKDERRKAQ